MPIEIRQLLVKTNVVDDDERQPGGDSQENLDSIRKEILEECRKMMFEIIREERER